MHYISLRPRRFDDYLPRHAQRPISSSAIYGGWIAVAEPETVPETAEGGTAPAGAVEVARRIRAARAKIGMTRRQLALASGTSERYLAHLEQGVGNPSLGVLTGLAETLDVALADLLPRGGERSDAQAEAAGLLRRLPEPRLAVFLDALRQSQQAPGAKARRIVLVGLRGAGKSSLGAALAARLGMRFIEISQEVERAYGAEIGLLIELSGQSALRRHEREAWERIVAAHSAVVIAAPGGIVADPALYDRLLASAHAIWLQATPDDHMARVMAQGDFRPMASNRGAMADLKAILAARSGDYARADATLDTSAQDFEATLALLEPLAAALMARPAL
jgi:XRE family aerobic/anaerobic benzoate catabolism transcriptional regulator